MPPPSDRPKTRWTTRLVQGEPRDIKLDAATGQPLAVASWTPPRGLLRPERCANCGGARRLPDARMTIEGGGVRVPTPQCSGCGLTSSEDYDRHAKIVTKLHAMGFVDACDRAARTGRHVLALKLATAGVQFGEDIHRSRLQRLRELSRIGYHELVQEEVKAWLDTKGTSPGVALEVAELLLTIGERGDALAVLGEGLRHAPNAALMMLRRAQVAHSLADHSTAIADAVRLATPEGDHLDEAIELIAAIADALIAEQRAGEAIEVIGHAAPTSHAHPVTAFALARAEQARGELSTARRWAKHTLHLEPEHEAAQAMLREIEDILGLASTL